MGVTLARLRSLTTSMKAVLAAIVVVAILVTATNIASLRGAADHLTLRQTRKSPMTHVTFNKDLDGATLTLTIYRNEGESMTAFGARARAEWTEFLAGWGG